MQTFFFQCDCFAFVFQNLKPFFGRTALSQSSPHFTLTLMIHLFDFNDSHLGFHPWFYKRCSMPLTSGTQQSGVEILLSILLGIRNAI